MTLIAFLILVLIAAVCGAIGQALVGYSIGGCLISAVIGWIGAFIGWWIARNLGLPAVLTVDIGGQAFPVFWSIIGSVVLVAVLSLFSGRRRWYR